MSDATPDAPAAAPATHAPAAALAAPPNVDKYQPRLGSALTPQTITPILRLADLGHMQAYADLLDEVRAADAHLHAVLAKRELEVAGAPWEVRPARVGGRRAERVADFVDGVLRSLPSFSALVAHLQSAIYHGRAAAELVWSQRATPQGLRFVPVQAVLIHPRRLSYAATDWRLRLWDASGNDLTPALAGAHGRALDEFAPGKFVVHTPRVLGGYPTREGLGRPLVWLAAFKRFVIRDSLAHAELSGRMARVGKWNTGSDGKKTASPQHVAELTRALEDWSAGAALVIPDTTDVTFEKPASGESVHRPLIELFDAQMSKAALGGTLTTDAGTKGARSLGDTQRDEQLMIARADAISIVETLTRGLIEPLVLLNFGERARALIPELAFVVDPPESLDAAADRIVKLVGAGLDIEQDDVRDLFGYRTPREGAKLMVPRAGPRGGVRSGGGAADEKPANDGGSGAGDAPANDDAEPAENTHDGGPRVVAAQD